MRLFLSIAIVASCVVLAGCGGGGGSSSPTGILATSSDGKTVLMGQAAAVPNGVTLDVQSESAVALPGHPLGTAFVAGASCEPAGTTFTQSVSLVFHLAAFLDPSTEVRLYKYVSVPSDQWADTGVRAVISADGLTATVTLDQFNTNAANPYYMLVSAL